MNDSVEDPSGKTVMITRRRTVSETTHVLRHPRSHGSLLEEAKGIRKSGRVLSTDLHIGHVITEMMIIAMMIMRWMTMTVRPSQVEMQWRQNPEAAITCRRAARQVAMTTRIVTIAIGNAKGLGGIGTTKRTMMRNPDIDHEDTSVNIKKIMSMVVGEREDPRSLYPHSRPLSQKRIPIRLNVRHVIKSVC